MKSNSQMNAARRPFRSCLAFMGIAGFVLTIAVRSAQPQQCDLTTGAGNFSSGSDGSDGNYDLSATPSGTIVKFKLSDFHGTGVSKNIFNFNKIIVPAGVTIKFSETYFHGPVYWLAQSDVTINGKLDLSGDVGIGTLLDASLRTPAPAGSGGYPGGIGGGGSLGPQPGSGPGGGAAQTSGSNPLGGQFIGSNTFLFPLVGGSGGGGQNGGGGGGGGGGGAIMIASSTSIAVNGAILANGGPGYQVGNEGAPGSGSGGAIRLIANSVYGSGGLNVSGTSGGYYGQGNSGNGVSRVEACSYSGLGATIYLTPLVLPLPKTQSSTIQVTNINGVSINENPFSFPDTTINTAAPVPVVITAHQIPPDTQPTLYIWSASGDQTLTCPTGGLQGSLATSTCTINVPFVYGGSRGYVKTTWAQ